MTFKQALLAAIAVSALALSPAAFAAGEHDMGGMKMSGDMDKTHEEMEAKLADTSAFGEKGDPSKATKTVKVAGEEIRYDVTSLTLKTGDTITFQFTNKGEQPHEVTIGDAAYQLGDVYESRAYRQFRRAAAYFERCFQWNPNTSFDARLRAARLHDKALNERGKAIELYKSVTVHDTDPKRVQEAQRRLNELNERTP